MRNPAARAGVSPIAILRAALLMNAVLACAGRGPGVVSPQDVPGLQARLAKEPNNQALLSRYAAALLAANTCDSAQAVARKDLSLNPADAVGTLVMGQCL